MKLTPRQRQISLLRQRGAAYKEIALVLGIEEATVKSTLRDVAAMCREEGIDIFALPIERKARMEALAGLVRHQVAADTFGGANAQQ